MSSLTMCRKLPPRSVPLALAFGADELPELQRLSRAYASAREAADLPVELLPLAAHHFSILEELIDPAGRLSELAVRLAASSPLPRSR